MKSNGFVTVRLNSERDTSTRHMSKNYSRKLLSESFLSPFPPSVNTDPFSSSSSSPPSPSTFLIERDFGPCIYPSFRPSVRLAVRPYTHPPIRLTVRPSIHVNPFIHPSIHPSVRPSVHPSIHPSIR